MKVWELVERLKSCPRTSEIFIEEDYLIVDNYEGENISIEIGDYNG
jgi:hypothetical protein